MDGTGRDGPAGARIVLLGGDGYHGGTVAVAQLEHLAGNLRPARGLAGAGAVVGAIGCSRVEQMEDRARHIRREGEAADLVVHHRDAPQRVPGVGDAIGERRHGLHEVPAVADHPARAEDVVRGAAGHGDIARSLGLAVHAQRAHGLVLGVHVARTVEDVVRAHVHERDAVLGAGPRQERRSRRVRLPAGHASLVGLGPVDRRVGAAVDDGAVEAPVVLAVRSRVGHVEGVDVAVVEGLSEAALLGERAHGAAELSVAPRHEGALRLHGDHVAEIRMVLVRLGDLAPIERDGPLDGELGVGEVHEGVGLLELGGPVRVHQVGVGGSVLERLVGVAHAARHEDRLGGVQHAGVDAAVGGAARAQVNPRAEDRARRDGDELVPRLGMDAARGAGAQVEADVVLHPAEVREPQALRHLLALPVLLEPAAAVAVHGQVEHPEALDARLLHLELLLVFDRGHVRAPPLSAVQYSSRTRRR